MKPLSFKRHHLGALKRLWRQGYSSASAFMTMFTRAFGPASTIFCWASAYRGRSGSVQADRLDRAATTQAFRAEEVEKGCDRRKHAATRGIDCVDDRNRESPFRQ